MAEPKPVADQDVFSLTALGRAQLHGTATSLARESLQLLVLVDGRATVAQVARSAPGMSAEAVRSALAGMVADGLVGAGDGGHPFGAIDPGDFFTVTSAAKAPGAGLRDGEFEKGVASLKDSGYFVSIARRAETSRSRDSGARPVAVVVEDDPDLAKLLRTYLKLEGIETVIAANRAEVVAAFRRASAPDVVLLDVQLPDLDGFDVLSRIRQHPLLKAVPVIMLTGEATRSAVLKGIHGGADGYVTKPFQVDVVMKAVRTVLGPE
ncbi:MAG TPA: response regulator [Burkholderiales bacterium]|jgi:CheY-like chemotaxis protein